MYKVFDTGLKKFTSPNTAEQAISGLWRIDEIILNTIDIESLAKRIVNVMLEELGYLKFGYVIIVLSLLDKEKEHLKRISISETPHARKALKSSPIPFKKIVFSIEDKENLTVKSLLKNESYVTEDLSDMLHPAIDRSVVRQVQKNLGILTSLVFPIYAGTSPLGTIIFSLNKKETKISDFEKQILIGFTNATGIAIQHAYLLKKLREANEKLKEIDKLKDEFVSLAGHELRTPMTVIKSYLWLALSGKGGDLTDKLKDYLDKAYSSTDRLIKLVNDMLNVSRIESGRIAINVQKVDLVKLTEDVVGEVKPKFDEGGIKLIFNKPESQPFVIADPDKIKEVLINLVGNALKFTPKDGEIRINFEHKDGMVVTHVSDTGQGIGPEDLPRLFQKFSLIQKSYVTNKQASLGTGLGLYISKSIVKIHKGEIWAESDGIGKGATFSFSLKVYKQADFESMRKGHESKQSLGLIHREI